MMVEEVVDLRAATTDNPRRGTTFEYLYATWDKSLSHPGRISGNPS
jgi:hypothetical protein